MDVSSLPREVLQQLRELEEELEEGDITRQGFEKKKARLLLPYQNLPADRDGTASTGSSSSGRSVSPAPPSSLPFISIEQQNSEARARAAAVHAALERSKQEADETLQLFSRRTNARIGQDPIISPSQSFDTASTESGSSRTDTPHTLPTASVTPPPTLPKSPAVAQRQQQLHLQQYQAQMTVTGPADGGTPGRGGVSHKIQQLLNTLKRPKKHARAVEEYYTDDDDQIGDGAAASPSDPSAPRPVGPLMQPVSGVPLESRQDWHRNLEAAIQHHSSTIGKQPAFSVVDSHGKGSVHSNYVKLAVRAQKIAHYLLNKLGGGKLLQTGDRVALVFRGDEGPAFATAIFGCIFAAVIPVAIDPPMTKDDPGGQQVGFLLNSLGIQVAITSEMTARLLPKEEGKDHIVHFKGWPRLTWFVAEHLPKPSRDWTPPPRPTPDTIAYIEFTAAKDGSVLGVTISRSDMLTHCRSLTTACHYKEGEVVICTEDPKRSIGFWHGVLAAAYNGLHVVFVPLSVMATLPTVWLLMINKYKATCVITSSRALGGSINVASHKELKDVSLEEVRMLLLDDGANPWSLASSDLFYDAFQSKGLVREVLCPCAGSPETLTVSLRRPSPMTPTGRGVMSISGLSYGVVRVEEPGSITSLTLQDVGLVMPGARVAVVKVHGLPILCRTDEVGEICIQSTASGCGYWGLQGKTAATFKMQPLDEQEKPVFQGTFVRSGLLGFVGEGGLVFICGTMDGLIIIGGRRHNTEDLIATVMAVEPHNFVYKGRIAVFSVTILKEERVVVVAEQKPGCTDEEAFTWMNSVVPAVESIHGINLYGIVLVAPGRIPRRPGGSVYVHETRQKFIEGMLRPVNLLMCPYQCITNLPVPKPLAAVTGAAQVIGDLVTGRTMDSGKTASVDEQTTTGEPEFLTEKLRQRALSKADDVLFTLMDSKGQRVKTMNSGQLHKKAERIGGYLLDKLKLNTKDYVALIFHPGIDLISAFYGCLYAGIVPVVVKPPSPNNLPMSLPVIKLTVELSKSKVILSSHGIIRLMKSKEALQQNVDLRSLPNMVDIEDISRRKFDKIYRPPTTELIAYLDFSVSTTGVLSGVKMSHAAILSMCRAHQQISELYPSREIALCLDPYSGMGLFLWCLSGVFSGHHTILMNPFDLELNPTVWLSVLSQNKVRDTYCSYAVIDLCCRELGTSVEAIKTKGIDLSSVRLCTIVSEERPRLHLINSFTTLFGMLGLQSRAVNASFGCKVNPMICLQGVQHPRPSNTYVDSRAMRVDRVALLEKGSPRSTCLMESGKIAPYTRVIVVNPETRTPCPHTELGEVWVSSSHNGSGFYGLKEEVNDTLSKEYFRVRISGGGDTSVSYARTGYFGFLMKSDYVDQRGVPSTSLYVVGAIDEALPIRGFRYHPIDLETSVIRCHKSVSGCAVFISNKLLVVAAELQGDEGEALDVVPVITTTLLEEHQLVAGIVVVVDPGTIPVNSRGEKQRAQFRDSFLADEIDPIYVAYNL